MTPFERALAGAFNADPFQRRLRAVHYAVASDIEFGHGTGGTGPVLQLGRPVDQDTQAVFLDEIGHPTERANGMLAARILDPLLAQLGQGAASAAQRPVGATSRLATRCGRGATPRTSEGHMLPPESLIRGVFGCGNDSWP